MGKFIGTVVDCASHPPVIPYNIDNDKRSDIISVVKNRSKEVIASSRNKKERSKTGVVFPSPSLPLRAKTQSERGNLLNPPTSERGFDKSVDLAACLLSII